jgi:hypothetical protein
LYGKRIERDELGITEVLLEKLFVFVVAVAAVHVQVDAGGEMVDLEHLLVSGIVVWSLTTMRRTHY